MYAGWLRAVRAGHAALHRGLDVAGAGAGARLGALLAARPRWATTCTPPTSCSTSRQIRRWSTSVGRHVTYVGVDGARHDVVLSRPAPRARAYAELARWLTAYVDGPPPDVVTQGRA